MQLNYVGIASQNSVLESYFMKKISSRCAHCAEDSPMLTQVSSGPEITFLCSDCYNLKYSKEVQNEFKYIKKEKS